jgi:hypothetical protein
MILEITYSLVLPSVHVISSSISMALIYRLVRLRGYANDWLVASFPFLALVCLVYSLYLLGLFDLQVVSWIMRPLILAPVMTPGIVAWHRMRSGDAT